MGCDWSGRAMKECVHQGQEQQQQQSLYSQRRNTKEYEEINAETRCKAGTVHRFCGGFGRGLWVVGW